MMEHRFNQNQSPELAELCKVITEAGKLGSARALTLQTEGFERFSKAGLTEVNELLTSADLESQKLITDFLIRHYPNIPILAEEQDQHEG